MRNLLLLPVVFGMLAGCGGTPEPVAEKPKPPEAPRALDLPSVGVITGRVDFGGEKPKLKRISMDAVPACAKQHTAPVEPEDVIINSNGTLANVFVHIKSGLPARAWPLPKDAVKLNQKGCIYSPHVLLLRTGQNLAISNSDSMMHNVHPLTKSNEEWNEAQPPQEEQRLKQFPNPEVMIPFVCNMHPWMRAYVNVTDHPYAVITGADGSFRLLDVPPGEYVLEAVHELFGTKTLTLSVGAREVREVAFRFSGK